MAGLVKSLARPAPKHNIHLITDIAQIVVRKLCRPMYDISSTFSNHQKLSKVGILQNKKISCEDGSRASQSERSSQCDSTPCYVTLLPELCFPAAGDFIQTGLRDPCPLKKDDFFEELPREGTGWSFPI